MRLLLGTSAVFAGNEFEKTSRHDAMGRIRTVKPEFFDHEGIYDAESQSGLPLRIAFIGLWTQADREGRFRVEPRRLKSRVLPFDDVDFSRVLDALATRGFIRIYSVKGRQYACIPSWHDHQTINNRERDSELPGPELSDCGEIDSTRAPRVDDACPTPLKYAQAERNKEQGIRNKEQEEEGPQGGGSCAKSRKFDPTKLEVPTESEEVRALWLDWCESRRQIGKPIKEKAAKQQLENIREMGDERAIAALKHSIAGGYQGLFEPNYRGSPSPQKTNRPSGTYQGAAHDEGF